VHGQLSVRFLQGRDGEVLVKRSVEHAGNEQMLRPSMHEHAQRNVDQRHVAYVMHGQRHWHGVHGQLCVRFPQGRDSEVPVKRPVEHAGKWPMLRTTVHQHAYRAVDQWHMAYLMHGQCHRHGVHGHLSVWLLQTRDGEVPGKRSVEHAGNEQMLRPSMHKHAQRDPDQRHVAFNMHGQRHRHSVHGQLSLRLLQTSDGEVLVKWLVECACNWDMQCRAG
jgi:hypothetical protein